jgi:hypothetical protein
LREWTQYEKDETSGRDKGGGRREVAYFVAEVIGDGASDGSGEIAPHGITFARFVVHGTLQEQDDQPGENGKRDKIPGGAHALRCDLWRQAIVLTD